ncbi:MAG: VOC family protein [Sandaracinaceae bacterium]|jgi:uncharacterized glyoxalase superfamily protein PhnB|nr:VOC family protein [Sandaracinaceae bacterium]
MKPTPPNWPRISSAVFYVDPRKAIDWLCKAFGFTVRIVVDGPNGSVEHSELGYGEGVVMVSSSQKSARGDHRRSPSQIAGGNTQSIMVYVDDVEAHCAQARAHGAIIVSEPTTNDYGEEYWSDRTYETVDLEGHRWWFCERLRSPANTD